MVNVAFVKKEAYCFGRVKNSRYSHSTACNMTKHITKPSIKQSLTRYIKNKSEPLSKKRIDKQLHAFAIERHTSRDFINQTLAYSFQKSLWKISRNKSGRLKNSLIWRKPRRRWRRRPQKRTLRNRFTS